MKKICTVCKKEKSIKEFGPRSGVPHARASCRSCDSDYARSYRQRNLDRCKRSAAAYQRKLRRIPERAKKLRAQQKKCWVSGGRERQQKYLDKLKEANFFKWKARKSYIFLSDEQLKALWDKQQGLCALTGRVLGKDPHLDHIIPKTRGGDDSYKNSRWLCVEANQAKWNLLDDELIQLCREIVKWSERK